MKRMLCLLFALLLVMTCGSALTESGCWYYNQNGKHDFEQVKVSLATCTEDGYYLLECRQCGLNHREITGKAFGHRWGEAEDVFPAGCTEDGYASYTCEECGQPRTVTAPALGHSWTDVGASRAATCEQDGEMRTRCSRCGMTGTRALPRKNHAYGAWRVVQEATDHSSGKRVRSCSQCGKSEQTGFYPDGTLYPGVNQPEDVRALQQKLTDLGLFSDSTDGEYGSSTQEAVRAYQAQAGLTADGIAWPQTLNHLSSGAQTPDAPEAEQAFCLVQLDEQGGRHVQYCAIHQETTDSALALLEATDAEHELEALAQVRALWQAELERLYDEWQESASDEQRGAILASRSTFLSFLSLQETALAGQASEAAAGRRINALLEEQCLTLCALLHEGE